MKGAVGMVADEELYRRVLAGDEGALEVLVYRYHAPLLRFLYRYCNDLHLAHDLVQETFTRVVGHQGEPPRCFRAWIYTIAANLARDSLRSAYRRREEPSPMLPGGPEEPGWQPEAGGPPIDELLLRDAQRREVVAALQALAPVHRETLILRYYHDLSLEEIAQITGAPVGTVKSRIFHALRQLKAWLVREGGERHAAVKAEPAGKRSEP
jgi:RNA polymerase sigma-70 factor (ECF subfamily)